MSGDIGAGTGTVLDDEGLPEPIRKPLPHRARDDIESASCSGTDDDAHRPRRIGLRPCDARHDRQRGSASGQIQEFAAGKFHF
jgi:hypothetical protein